MHTPPIPCTSFAHLPSALGHVYHRIQAEVGWQRHMSPKESTSPHSGRMSYSIREIAAPLLGALVEPAPPKGLLVGTFLSGSSS